jgi:carboxypeptidase Q
MLEAFLDEGLPRGKAFGLLEQLCAVAPHRLSGSEGSARAVEWGLATMQLLGFENVRLEPVVVPRWERGDIEELVVVEPAEHAGEALALLALGGSVGTSGGGLEGDVVVVTSFEELSTRTEEVRGKLVLFNRPMDPRQLDPFAAYGGAVSQRTRGADEAAAHGALAALVRSMTLSHDDEPHTGAMRYGDAVERIPGAALSTNACDRIAQWIAAGKRVRLRLRLSCRTGEPVQSHNVVGEIVGRERPDEIVVIGGHLDAWDVGQGAHDDGAGCIHVLEAGRLIARAGSTLGRPRRTVRCVLFMNEENGLAGGEAYRDTHLSALARHVLAIESDRGGFLPLGYSTDAEGEVRAFLEGLWGGPPSARGGGADISPLAASGVTLAGLYPSPQSYFDVHHSRHDVVATVSPRELQLGAIVLASMAWLAADHPGEWPRAEVTAP